MKNDNESRELFRQPSVRIAPFMAAGMILAYFCSGGVCAVITVSAAAFAVYLFMKKDPLALCAVGAAAGLLIAGIYFGLYYSSVLAYNGRSISGEFTVTDSVWIGNDSQNITVKMTLDGRTTKVRLYSATRLDAGQIAHAYITFGDLDEEYKLYALSNGILLSGEAKNVRITSREVNDESFLKMIRRGFIGTVEQSLFGEERALAKAMLFGDDLELSHTMTERLRICGAAHYTAVSGTHFAVFAAVMLSLIPQKKRKARAIGSLLFAPIAVLFFGMSASVLRAAVMFIINGCALLFRRTPEPLNTLCVSFVILSICSPGLILDVGFAMSILGVLGVAVAGPQLSKRLCGLLPKKAKWLSYVITTLSVSVSAVVCTAPVSAAFFKGVSLTGALTSILLAPLMAVGMIFAALTAITGAGFLAVPLALAMKLSNIIISFFGNIRGAWLSLNFIGAWAMAALFALILIIGVFHDAKALRSCAVSMAIIAVFCLCASAYVSAFRSETVIIENSRGSAEIVFDGGKADVAIHGSGVGLAGKISRTLRENGAKRIGLLTAPDADFSGAIAIKELSELVEIKYIETNAMTKAVLKQS